MTPHEPEPCQCSCQLQGKLCLARRLEPVEGGAEVVVLAVEPVEELAAVGRQVRLRFLRECQEVLRVTAPLLLGVARLLEPLGGYTYDRLQHPEAVLGVAQKALVDE